jgi:heat-inducible transcriptional repressor
VSSATIRNRMAVLEREGYIAKTHTSSGRVPTDDGYRAYVDDFQQRRQGQAPALSPADREALRANPHDVNAIMMRASKLLANLSRNFAVVYGAIEQECRVRSIKLVELDGARVLVVANLEPEYERTSVLRFEQSFTSDVIAASEQLINRMVSGLSLEEARDSLDRAVRDNVTDEGIIAREVAVHRDAIFVEPPAVEFYFEERSHLLDQPELSDPKNLQSILRILHNKPYLTSILSNRSREGTEVTIGDEHSDEMLKPFSLITAGYRMGAAQGVLGIIGPTRMRYDRALTVVGALSRELRALGEEFF